MALICVTDTGGLDFAAGLERLDAAGHETIVLEATDPGEVVERAAEADALIVSFVPVDAEVLAALPHVRAIATTTVGLDQIDLDAARSAGVDVRPLPPLASEEVATHALAGMLAVLREIPAGRDAARDWDFRQMPAPRRISELTLALYGMGRIAQELAVMARPLFARVVAYDPYVIEASWPTGVERVTTPEALFSAADVLSLHAPATAQTRHVVNARAIGLMPYGAVVVNVARGELVDQDALVDALDIGRLRGAFLDVLDPEPPAPDDPVLQHPRIVVTPHAGFYSDVTARDYVLTAIDNVLAALAQPVPS